MSSHDEHLNLEPVWRNAWAEAASAREMAVVGADRSLAARSPLHGSCSVANSMARRALDLTRAAVAPHLSASSASPKRRHDNDSDAAKPAPSSARASPSILAYLPDNLSDSPSSSSTSQ